MVFIKYFFEDGSVLILHNVGLADDELSELEKNHGKYVIKRVIK